MEAFSPVAPTTRRGARRSRPPWWRASGCCTCVTACAPGGARPSATSRKRATG